MRSLCTVLLSALTFAANAQLSGTYTIGGTAPDYPTVTDAVSDLMTVGVAGNVTFSIRPGTYVGRYTLTTFPGPNVSVVFRSETNNAADVVLQHAATSASDNHIFSVSGVKSVFFQDLTFRPLGASYSRAIHLFNDADLFQVIDCAFETPAGGAASGGGDRVFIHCDQSSIGTTDNPDDVFIDGCSFRNNYGAVELSFTGLGGARSQGLYITDNTFIDQVGFAVLVNAAVGQIGDNTISTTVGDSYVGIRATYVDGGSQFRRNRVEARSSSQCTGMEISNTQLTNGNIISNNMVYASGSTGVVGLLVYNLWGMKVLHNSVLVASGDVSTSFAFHHLGVFADGQDTEVRNNIFSNEAGGHAYRLDLSGNIPVEDHNCLFTTGSEISWVEGVAYAALTDHQTGTGLGGDDQAIDPVFPVRPDLHLNHCTLDGRGTYIWFLVTDIDGDVRNNPSADMGADEFTFSQGAIVTSLALDPWDLPYDLAAPNGGGHTWSTGEFTQTISIGSGGTYDCTYTDVNGCNYTVSWVVTVSLATAVPLQEPTAPVVYPNPAHDELLLDAPVMGAELFDAAGRRVGNWSRTARLDGLGGLPRGCYALAIIGTDGTTSRRTIILH
ncbi:MAG: hypothetical protein JNL05_11855 [Flavobacteriales bacterium]|nr:hypothetical protein [Flavobacteriales bacterium]